MYIPSSRLSQKNMSAVWLQQLKQRKHLLSLLFLFLWPWIIMLFVPNWIYFNTSGNVDSWMYTGHFLNFPQYLKIYADQDFYATTQQYFYYISRISWIIPGYIVYHLFPPLIANLVLRLSLFYLSVFSIYGILCYVQQRSAFLIAVLLGGYSYFLFAIGWDYVDGAGIAYFLLLSFFLVSAHYRQQSWLFLLLAGVCIAALISVNIFAVSLFPAIALLFIFQRYHHPQKMLYEGIIIAIGAISMIIILGLINVGFGGEFLFLSRSFLFARFIVSLDQNLWTVYVADWPLRYGHILWPQIGFFACLLLMLMPKLHKYARSSQYGGIYIYIYSITAMIFLFWQFRGGTPVLRIVFYASYLIGPLFLALGAIVAPAVVKLSRKAYIGLIILAMFASLAGPLSRSCETVTPTLIIVGLCIGLVWIVMLLLAPTSLWQLIVFVVALGFAGPSAYSNIGSLTTCQSVAHPGYPRQVYAATFATHTTIQKFVPGQRVYFWYNYNEDKTYQNIACVYMWIWNLIGEEFPKIAEMPDSASTVALLSRDPTALDQAIAILEQQGRKASVVGQDTITEGSMSFRVYVLHVSAP